MQEIKLREVDTRIETEIAGLRTAIETAKVSFLRVFSLFLMGMGKLKRNFNLLLCSFLSCSNRHFNISSQSRQAAPPYSWRTSASASKPLCPGFLRPSPITTHSFPALLGFSTSTTTLLSARSHMPNTRTQKHVQPCSNRTPGHFHPFISRLELHIHNSCRRCLCSVEMLRGVFVRSIWIQSLRVSLVGEC